MANGTLNTSESVIKKLLKNVIQEELQPVKDEMRLMKNEMSLMKGEAALMKDDMKQMKKEMRDYRDEVTTIKDEIIAELQTTREETAIDKGLHRRILDMEDDVDQLKKIHPQGAHAN